MGAEQPDVLEHFAANVKRLRTRASLTQKQLAELLDVDERYLQRIERGSVNVGLVTVGKFAAVLDVPASQLLRKASLPKAKVGRPQKRSR